MSMRCFSYHKCIDKKLNISNKLLYKHVHRKSCKYIVGQVKLYCI